MAIKPTPCAPHSVYHRPMCVTDSVEGAVGSVENTGEDGELSQTCLGHGFIQKNVIGFTLKYAYPLLKIIF